LLIETVGVSRYERRDTPGTAFVVVIC
jgi:hypothetical protein